MPGIWGLFGLPGHALTQRCDLLGAGMTSPHTTQPDNLVGLADFARKQKFFPRIARAKAKLRARPRGRGGRAADCVELRSWHALCPIKPRKHPQFPSAFLSEVCTKHIHSSE